MESRGRLLNEFDQEEAGLRAHCAQRSQADREMAGRETAALIALANGIARSLGEWRELASGLDLRAPLDPRRAGALVLEGVFDEILSGPQWRLLAAAFALAELAA
jgi:hypothetical protein